MWRIVDYKQEKPRRSRAPTDPRTSSARECAITDVGNDVPFACIKKNITETIDSATSANKIVKWLRHTARNIAQKSSTFRSSLAPHAQDFVRSLMSPPITVDTSKSTPHGQTRQRMCIVALGIGDFNPHISRVSFLQMATLLALRDVCEAEVKHIRSKAPVPAPKVDTTSTCEQQSSTTEEDIRSASSTQPTVSVSIKFYDPLSQPLHHACCHALHIDVERQNEYGVYRARSADDYVLMFMPHCPWELFHNTVVANWPENNMSCDALRRVLWIANSLHAIPLDTTRRPLCIFDRDVIGCFDVQPIGAPSNADSLLSSGERRRRRRMKMMRSGKRNNCTPHGEQEDVDVPRRPQDVFVVTVGGGGSLFTLDEGDMCCALSDMAVMRVRGCVGDAQIAETLSKVPRKCQSVVKKSHELF